MELWLLLFGLALLGLLIALVVFGALMYEKMTKMCCTSDEIAANAKATQTNMAALLGPLATQGAAQAAAQAAAANATANATGAPSPPAPDAAGALAAPPPG